LANVVVHYIITSLNTQRGEQHRLINRKFNINFLRNLNFRFSEAFFQIHL